MKLRSLLMLAVVVGLIAPAAGASFGPQSDSPQPLPQQSTAVATATASADSGGGEPASAANYTRLYLDDGYRHLELKPGESETIEVTVENGEDEAVTLSPHLVLPKVRDRPVETDWVTIKDDELTVEAGAERTVTATVEIPEDASLGRYQGWIAFTDETVTYPGRPPRPVHALGLAVEVWKEPTVQIRGDRYFHAQIEAGDTLTYEVTVKNTGEEAVPLSPELETRDRHRRPRSNTVDRSWFEIAAPAEVAPGEEETVEVRISPPADADRGRYDAELSLGLKDPARPEHDSHWQRLNVNFQVWKQPEEPFETSFNVAENTSTVTLQLSPRTPDYPRSAETDDPEAVAFDVVFVSPDGNRMKAERVQVTDRGFVDLSDARREPVTTGDSEYVVRGNDQEFRYRIADPAAGQWDLRVMPENTIGFGYEVIRDESAG